MRSLDFFIAYETCLDFYNRLLVGKINRFSSIHAINMLLNNMKVVLEFNTT